MAEKTAQERREAQREAIRKQRQAELKRQRNVRIAVIAAIVVVALVLVAGLGYLIYRSTRPAGPPAPPEGVAADQPYYEFGAPADSDAPVLDLHVDFMCPGCGAFEQINGDDIVEMVDDEDVTLRMYTRNFLDGSSTTGDYSTRAANAFACVYGDDPDNAMAYQQALFADQPAEQSPGLDDDTLFSMAQDVGASDAVQTCIDDGAHNQWVRAVAEPAASEQGEGSTPFVRLDGEVLDAGVFGQEGQLREAVDTAVGEAGSSDGGEG